MTDLRKYKPITIQFLASFFAVNYSSGLNIFSDVSFGRRSVSMFEKFSWIFFTNKTFIQTINEMTNIENLQYPIGKWVAKDRYSIEEI